MPPAPTFPVKLFGPATAQKFTVLLAGFPDTETSGWGSIIDELAKDHRVACFAFPGNTKDSALLVPHFGHSWSSLAHGIHASIEQVCAQEGRHSFSLLVHDWGAFLGLSYATSHPQRITRMAVFDVGMLSQPSLKQALVVMFYQGWFAFAFLLSCTPLIGPLIADLFLAAFFYTPINSLFGPCPYEKKTGMHAALKEGRGRVTARMCYVYFRFWLSLLLRDGAPKAKFPQCPTLFLYGTRKRIMFHDKRFIEKLAAMCMHCTAL